LGWDVDRNFGPDTRQYIKGFLRGKISGDMEEVIFAETENDAYKFVAIILGDSSVEKHRTFNKSLPNSCERMIPLPACLSGKGFIKDNNKLPL
jgi:hypothetical protein